MTVESSREHKIWITRRKRYGPSGFSENGMQKVRENLLKGSITRRKNGYTVSEKHR